ncbi:peptidase S8/S53 domain-containing protein [Mycena polygramma]|nr:peptidase S8/S53 domain-containing protein [Mycena polygramma]
MLRKESFSSSLVDARPVFRAIDGGVVQTSKKGFDYNGESNLDLQYAMNLVTAHQPVTLYQLGDLEQGGSLNSLLDALDGSFYSFEGGDDPDIDPIYPDASKGGYEGHDCGTIKPAHVISISYGANEADLSAAYTARQCAEYAKLGLMGVTVLFSSGDYGVAGNGNICLNPDGMHGGGFSNYFRMPDYQKGAVAGYMKAELSTGPYSHKLLNSTGKSRAYPDLSANGNSYVIAEGGKFALLSGTSASAPVVGAMLAMINDARLAIHKKPIGFINPTIYSPKFKRAFNDITSGRNPGCGTAGFAAAKGFDPVTGLGTPRFPDLLDLWLHAP